MTESTNWKILFESALDAVIGVNDRDEIIDWNKQAENIFGWSKGEVVGSLLNSTIIPPEFRERHKAGFKKFLATGEGPILNRRIQVPALHRSGKLFPVELTVIPIQSEGKYLFYSFIRDLSEQKQIEFSLKLKSEALENSLNGFDIVNEDGKFIYVNKAYLRMWGYNSLEEVLATSPADHCVDPETPAKIISELKRTGKCDIHFEAKRKNGAKFDVRMLCFLAHDANGKEIYPSTSIDITAQKRFTEKLTESERKLDQIFNESPATLSLMVGPDLIYEKANQRFYEYSGRHDSVIGRSAKELYGRGYSHFVERLEKVYQTGEPYAGRDVPVQIKTDEGVVREHYIDFIYQPLKDNDGKVYGIVSQTFDVTEKVLARKSIEDSKRAIENERQNFRNLFKQTPEMVCILKGPDHVFEFVNEAHIRVLGFDATGRSVREAQPESVEVHGILDEVYRSGITKLLREIPVTVGQRLRYFDLTYAARHDQNGEINGIMILGIEVTDQVLTRESLRQAKEEAEKANQLKSAFLANMSHEIRTPLGAMLGFADLLRDPSLNLPERKNYLDIVVRNGEQLSVIINDILDLSKVEAGHLSVEFAEIAPERLMKDVVSLLDVKAKEKDLVLEIERDSSTPDTIVSDPVRVRQVLLNLIGNAIKFTQYGSIRIRSYGKELDGRQILCFEVIDSGIGIPQAQHEKVFEMFVQADDSLARKFGGTGLGLNLSRKLARAMGGDVRLVSSEPGKGTKVEFYVVDKPEHRSKSETRRAPASTAELPQNVLAGMKVLVVDDSPDNQRLIWQYLSRRGALIDTAENGLVGYKKCITGDFDVVLMDIQMPEMDGYAATAKLREHGYKKPIIALTAHAMQEMKQKCIKVGCTDHLTKPINAKDLISTVARYGRRNGGGAELTIPF